MPARNNPLRKERIGPLALAVPLRGTKCTRAYGIFDSSLNNIPVPHLFAPAFARRVGIRGSL